MSIPGHISIKDYNYHLPHERIAEYPMEMRDHSQLLVMDSESIVRDAFYNLNNHMPEGGLMVFNNTRVIRARLIFRKETGARIEIFCLEPVLPTTEINSAFEAASPVSWKCLIGNAKKWRSGKLQLDLGEIGTLYAERTGELAGAFEVRFSWDKENSHFAEILEAAGKVPLPPYIEREVVEEDIQRYQTIYAKHDGSVAAPTAGLHFTDEVMQSLKEKNVKFQNVILHVGAGTFKPVDHDDIHDHEMHNEQVVIRRSLLEDILSNEGPLTAIGTTSMRTLESIYWYGVMLDQNENASFSIKQWLPYSELPDIPTNKSLQNVLDRMQRLNIEEISGNTSLIIVPGYRFRLADILLTNFHMPRSTLLLLVAAFSGSRWKDAYRFAMENDFRFLSYGDSCLFFRKDQNL
jgi:S-adenosylmethionine:tRNA ribosyltransferase-isomerase